MTGGDSSRSRRAYGLPIYLTVREAAEVLRKSPKAVYTMIDRGQLPGVYRLGRSVRIKAAELLDWIEQSRAVSSEE